MQARPTPQRPRVTDDHLRELAESGLSTYEIATQVGINQSTVYRRLKRLDISTISAQMRPRESEAFVGHQIHAMAELRESLDRVRLLMQACDRWLRDPEDMTRYDVGPRAQEVDIIYEVEIETEKGYRREKRKKSLQDILLDMETVDGERVSTIKKGEYRHADPRDTILKTAQEVRSIVNTCVDLARMLVDVRALDNFRKALMQAISEVDPLVAQRIATALQRTAVFHSIGEGPGSIFAGADEPDTGGG